MSLIRFQTRLFSLSWTVTVLDRHSSFFSSKAFSILYLFYNRLLFAFIERPTIAGTVLQPWGFKGGYDILLSALTSVSLKSSVLGVASSSQFSVTWAIWKLNHFFLIFIFTTVIKVGLISPKSSIFTKIYLLQSLAQYLTHRK